MKRIIIKKTHSRRQFINNIIGAGILINLPLINSCNFKGNNDILDNRQKSIVDFVFKFLWPKSDKTPSIIEIKVNEYLIWVLSDKNVDPEENQYVLDGLKWIDETSVEDYNIHFEKLNEKQKEELLKKVVNIEWGESWLSKMLTITFEAMFADPIYGSNPNGIVWDWINHNPGQPRPTIENKYQLLLERKKENIAISSLAQLQI